MNRARWGLVQAIVGVGIFVWLRWYSALWQNRWVGLCLGLAVISTGFTSRERVRRHSEFARDLDLPKRVTILGFVAFTWMGVSAIRGFLGGPPFVSKTGIRAASDDGFFGVLICDLAVQYLYASWILLTKRSDQNSQHPALPVNHG